MLNPYSEAWQIRDLILKKEVSLREVAKFFNRRIEKLNPRLGAFMTPTPERAFADAARLEKASAQEIAKMPLYGIPYSLKDLTWTADIKTTMGSKNFEHFVPPADAEVAIRIRDAGGILLGKTATPEFGGRPTTEGGLCPPARNPWNLEHTAGGSSGGAACAAAAGLRTVSRRQRRRRLDSYPFELLWHCRAETVARPRFLCTSDGRRGPDPRPAAPSLVQSVTLRCSSTYSPDRSSAIPIGRHPRVSLSAPP